MKIQLDIRQEKYEAIKKELEAHGITVADEADLILSERGAYADFVSGKGPAGACHIPTDDLVYIESLGHDVILHALHDSGGAKVVREYRTATRLYELERQLDPEKFLRISNSVIIARRKVRYIRPALSQKFTLTMEGGDLVDVTRSYYYAFKDAFQI